MTEVAYATREDIKSALDVPETSRANQQIMREILASSRDIEGELGRYFYPTVSVQTFDWPAHQFDTPWRLWLDQRELVSVTQVLAAGTDITTGVMLRPDDAPLRGFPYTRLEIDLSTSAAFAAGATYQRTISVAGTFGFTAAETPGGTLVSAFTDTVGTVGTVSDSSLVDVGNIIRVDSERMNVTGRSMTTTGQTLTAGIAVSNAANVVDVSGTAFGQGETIMIDAEKMLVTDILSGQIAVQRAYGGSILAQHFAGTAIYAPRQLTVERGALGTTATTHAASAPIGVHAVPSLIRDWCVAETLSTLTQSRRGYTMILRRASASSSSSSGPGSPLDVSTALEDLRKRAARRYKRLRTRTAARLL